LFFKANLSKILEQEIKLENGVYELEAVAHAAECSPFITFVVCFFWIFHNMKFQRKSDSKKKLEYFQK
jgi:hypothetical protein